MERNRISHRKKRIEKATARSKRLLAGFLCALMLGANGLQMVSAVDDTIDPESGLPFTQSAPAVEETSPETGESTPETGGSAPETGESTPETGEPAPETGETTPEAGDPETSETTPATGAVAPPADSIDPESGLPVGVSMPTLGQANALLAMPRGVTAGTLNAKMDQYMRNFATVDARKTWRPATGATTDVGYYKTAESVVQLPDTWRQYVNRIWQYRAMGEVIEPTAAGSEITDNPDGGFDWATPTTTHNGWVWSGRRANATIAEAEDSANKDKPEQNPMALPLQATDGFYEVYSGEQLLYAMTPGWDRTSEKAVKVRLMADIDMYGAEMNWPVVSEYYGSSNHRVTIDGEGYTIYNLASFRYANSEAAGFGSVSYRAAMTSQLAGSCTLPSGAEPSGSRANCFFIGAAGFTVTNINFQNAKFVSTALGTENGTGIFGRIDSGMSTTTLEDININDSLFFSGLEASNVSPIGQMTTIGSGDRDIIVNRVGVQGCYVYGGDHCAGFSTGVASLRSGNASPGVETPINNSFTADTLIATYGGHSGGFISCHALNLKVDSCFSDIDMYAASFSGGFMGLATGTYTNCFSTGKLEGFHSCGGFSISVNNAGVNQPTTVSQCYSTVLVGMRSESEYMGGFHAPMNTIDYAASTAGMALGNERRKIASFTFEDCYAAGEVGNFGNELEFVNSSSTAGKNNGGFFSVTDTVPQTTANGHIRDKAVANCYYDKQTTAMRGWMTSDYNVRTNSKPADGQLAGLKGVLTSSVRDSAGDIQRVGLTATAEEMGFTSDDDFNGFSTPSAWVFCSDDDRRYPQLKVFETPTGNWNDNEDIARAYSLSSTATVLLDTWGYGFQWEDNIRTDVEQPFWDKDWTSSGGNKYTYDTVRDILVDFGKTQGSEFDYAIQRDGSKGAYIGDENDEIKRNEDNTPAVAIDLHNGSTNPSENHRGLVQNSGADWFTANNTVGSAAASRPIRLIALAAIDAGETQTIFPTERYDHRTDVKMYAVEKVINDLVLGMDDDAIWSKVKEGDFPEGQDGYSNIPTTDMNTDGVPTSHLNVEIWTVKQLSVPVGEPKPDDALLPDGYKWVQDNNQNEGYDDPNIDSEDVYKEVWYAYNPITDRYLDDKAVAVIGCTDIDGNVVFSQLDRDKWNGIIPLYPDTSAAHRYNIGYYWVTDDGRYISDVKSIRIVPGEYTVDIEVRNASDGSPNANALRIGVAKDKIEAKTPPEDPDNGDPNGNPNKAYTGKSAYVLSTAPSAYETTDIIDPDPADYEYSQDPEGLYVSDGAGGYRLYDSAKDDARTLRYRKTGKKDVKYGDNVSLGWEKMSDAINITSAKLEFSAREGTKTGSATITGGVDESKVFTVQSMNVYGTVPVKTVLPVPDPAIPGSTTRTIVREETREQRMEITYTITKDSNGIYELKIDKLYNRPDTELVDAGDTSGIGTTATDKDGNTVLNESYIDDTMYNTKLTLYVDDFKLSLGKQVQGDLADPSQEYQFMFETKELKAGMQLTYYTTKYNPTSGKFEADYNSGKTINGAGDKDNPAIVREEITLKHDEGIEIQHMFANMEYILAEKNPRPSGYAQTDYYKTEAFVDGSTSKASLVLVPFMGGADTEYGYVDTLTNYVRPADEEADINTARTRDVLFINTHTHIEPTGVLLNIFPPIAFLTVAVLGTLTLLHERRRRKNRVARRARAGLEMLSERERTQSASRRYRGRHQR